MNLAEFCLRRRFEQAFDRKSGGLEILTDERQRSPVKQHFSDIPFIFNQINVKVVFFFINFPIPKRMMGRKEELPGWFQDLVKFTESRLPLFDIVQDQGA